MNLTIKDAVEFILAHRKNKVFRNFTYAEIVATLVTAIKAKAFGYVLDGDRIVGVAVGEPNHQAKTMHVAQLLTTAPCLPRLLGLFKRHYPGWTITAQRRDRAVVYNTPRLCQLTESLYER